ncbi:hypothetical protein V7122_25110 [Bacillus sp. JJ1532]
MAQELEEAEGITVEMMINNDAPSLLSAKWSSVCRHESEGNQ